MIRTLPHDPITELRREDVGIVGPLPGRIAQIAGPLGASDHVEPAVISEGLGLWEGCRHSVLRARLEALEGRLRSLWAV